MQSLRRFALKSAQTRHIHGTNPTSNIPHQAPSELGDLTEARQKLTEAGFDPASFLEQRIAWGDQDPMQHVNNAQYARYFESTRIKWMMSFGHELGGPAKAEAMIRGKGISLIMKSLEIRFRRPVTYPDTLLIGFQPKPHSFNPEDPTAFLVTASAFSLTQRAFVATSNETLVWYDYDRLKKCDPGAEMWSIISKRGKIV